MKILFVCLGNICRSPTAEGVFRSLAGREASQLVLQADSAGTGDYHIGAPPDPRTQRAALERGYDLSMLRARQVEQADFSRFDLLLAMDNSNLAALRALAPAGTERRAALFLEYAPEVGRLEVPDPYCGTARDFDLVIELIERGARGLLQSLEAQSSRGVSSVPLDAGG